MHYFLSIFSEHVTHAGLKHISSLLSYSKYFPSQLNRFLTRVSNVSGTVKLHRKRTDIEFQRHLEENELLRTFGKKRSDFWGFYSFLVDDGVADTIVKEVMKSIKQKEGAAVIEVNPGMGKITKRLLKNGIKKLILWEPLGCVLCKEIIEQYKEIIELLNVDYQILALNQLDRVFPYDLYVNEGRFVLIIAINVNRIFIRRLIERVVLIDNNYWRNHEFYILVSADIYSELRSQFTSVRDFGCIDLIFDMEVLHEFPRSAVFPPSFTENKTMYFVRLQRKRLIFSNEHLVMYWNFVGILTRARFKFVIGVLEEWFPGCGPFLIANGLSMSTQVYELTKKDLVNLFKLLLDCQHFTPVMKILRNKFVFLQE